jgi:hypothetical protein
MIEYTSQSTELSSQTEKSYLIPMSKPDKLTVLDKIANFTISCQAFIFGHKIVLNDSLGLKMAESTP